MELVGVAHTRRVLQNHRPTIGCIARALKITSEQDDG